MKSIFELNSNYKPAGDQPQAIDNLIKGIKENINEQVMVGVTGSGKTFTMASVIERLGLPALILSHNKTLAGQLYQEFRDFFPKNAVSFFVSYYDYYQPEAYVPSSDTYIEKETEINEEIDKLRLAATTNILTRNDTIVVASVSCIYNIGSPLEYGNFILELRKGMKIQRNQIVTRLNELQYERNDIDFSRSKYRVRGDIVDIFPAYDDKGIRIILLNDFINEIYFIDPVSGNELDQINITVIYPAKHYMTDPKMHKSVFSQIRDDTQKQVELFKSQGKLIEAQRISQRVEYDLEMLNEVGYVNGIENYSRYFDGRQPGSAPYTLFEYFKHKYGNNWLLFIDESHMSIPQIRGMYNGDRARKQTLIDFGFRLPAALDNRPMRFDEFLRVIPKTIYVSATPNDWELGRAHENEKIIEGKKFGIVEQLVRPTGLLDPICEIRSVEGQINDLEKEIIKRTAKGERTLVTTLTKRMAEDLTKYLENKNIKVQYIHSDILTLERSEILRSLRMGKFDVIVGINLLREGLDLPEVTLVAILDADKEGFLRSKISLIQTMGRAARNSNGYVILYADKITKSIKEAVEEVERRRKVQIEFNVKNNITPSSINKPIRSELIENSSSKEAKTELNVSDINQDFINNLTPEDGKDTLKKLRKMMSQASHDLNFELAAEIRDLINSIQKTIKI